MVPQKESARTPRKSFRNGAKNSAFDQLFLNLLTLTPSVTGRKNIPTTFLAPRTTTWSTNFLATDPTKLLPHNPKRRPRAVEN
ncbi:hypothetical protein ACFX2B_027736 [Malus domestica]